MSQSIRPVLRTLRGQPASDGAGVKLTRVIGSPQLPDLDPFLMLDEFGTDRPEDYLAGVEVAKEHIRAGDAFQIVLSQRFDRPTSASVWRI